MIKEKRLPGLDIVRSIAIFFVIGGHFFLHTEYRNAPFEGWNLFFQGICTSLFLVSVPLFLLLTGFLNTNKKLSLKYYRGIIRVLSAYLVYSIITILYRIVVNGATQFSVITWCLKVMDFTVIPYGWYIEMYICLFLLIPFLNLLYNSLKSKNEKLVLIGTFLFLTALPPMLNRLGYKLVPDSFMILYPVTLYFIGTYIHEYKFKFCKLKLSFILLLLCTIDPLVNLVRGNSFIFFLGGRDSIGYIVIAIIVFLLFYDVDFKSKLIMKISLLSLDMYLCSWIFDNLYYGYFKTHYFESQQQFFAFFPIIVPLVFFSSFGVAWLREKANWGLKHIFVKQKL